MFSMNESRFSGRVTFVGDIVNRVRKTDNQSFSQVNVGLAITDNRGKDAGVIVLEAYNDSALKLHELYPVGLRIFVNTELRMDSEVEDGKRKSYPHFRLKQWQFIDTKETNDAIRKARDERQAQQNQGQGQYQNQGNGFAQNQGQYQNQGNGFAQNQGQYQNQGNGFAPQQNQGQGNGFAPQQGGFGQPNFGQAPQNGYPATGNPETNNFGF